MMPAATRSSNVERMASLEGIVLGVVMVFVGCYVRRFVDDGLLDYQNTLLFSLFTFHYVIEGFLVSLRVLREESCEFLWRCIGQLAERGLAWFS